MGSDRFLSGFLPCPHACQQLQKQTWATALPGEEVTVLLPSHRTLQGQLFKATLLCDWWMGVAIGAM